MTPVQKIALNWFASHGDADWMGAQGRKPSLPTLRTLHQKGLIAPLRQNSALPTLYRLTVKGRRVLRNMREQ